jgi:uncharacterized protein YbaR (Trm112 family)/SAM-dependent methyltransferase
MNTVTEGGATREDRLVRRLIPMLVCPTCKGDVVTEIDQGRILCPRCAAEYPIVTGVPIMMDSATRTSLMGPDSPMQSGEPPSSGFLSKIKHLTAPPSASLNTSPMAQRMLTDLGAQAAILDLGSGTHRLAEHVVNMDIDLFPNVDIVAAGQALPFSDSVFDGMITQAVLEHVPDPSSVICEMRRVLKHEGHIYAELPFLQGYHADPDDYQRFTLSGIRWLFRDFDTIDIGVCVGPSSALVWMLREYARLLVQPSEPLGKIMYRLVGWITLPLKYLDLLMARRDRAHVISAGLYFYGRKRQ